MEPQKRRRDDASSSSTSLPLISSPSKSKAIPQNATSRSKSNSPSTGALLPSLQSRSRSSGATTMSVASFLPAIAKSKKFGQSWKRHVVARRKTKGKFKQGQLDRSVGWVHGVVWCSVELHRSSFWIFLFCFFCVFFVLFALAFGVDVDVVWLVCCKNIVSVFSYCFSALFRLCILHFAL